MRRVVEGASMPRRERYFLPGQPLHIIQPTKTTLTPIS